jgi:hypothetical protein
MNGYRAELLTIARSQQVQLPSVLTDIARRRTSRANAPNRPLRCVSSGYLSDGCSCRSSIPTGVVTAAWRGELESGRLGEGFFHVAWLGGTWLAYGLPDGRVRGVYCPSHRSEREERLGSDSEIFPAVIERSCQREGACQAG